jgi:hypothetical protein
MKNCKECNLLISNGSKTGYCRKCSKIYFPVWNKGKTKSELPMLSNSGAKVGNVPHNKNKQMSEEQKIKLSCINRNISIDNFDDFSMPKSKRERTIFDDSLVKTECFRVASYSCDVCKRYGGKLNAHHLDGWNWCVEKRFDLSNLVCLCEMHHKEFHKLYGNKNNTNEQYQEFKKAKLLELGPI